MPPPAQLDPLVALLAALPADSGGTLLGGLGTIDHAFGLPWRLSWWGAYALLGAIISLLLILATIRLVQVPSIPLGRTSRPRWTGRGERQ